MFIHVALFFVGLLVLFPSSADQPVSTLESDSLRQTFRATYQNYLKAVDAKEVSEAHQLSIQALNLGASIYGEDDPKTAALTMNAALSYPAFYLQQDSDQGVNLMQTLVNRYETLYGRRSAEIIEPLLLLTEAVASRGYYNRTKVRRNDLKKRRERINRLTDEILTLINQHTEAIDDNEVLRRLSRFSETNAKSISQARLILQRKRYGDLHPTTLRARYIFANQHLSKKDKIREYEALAELSTLDFETHISILQGLIIFQSDANGQRLMQLQSLLSSETARSFTHGQSGPILLESPQPEITPRQLSKGLKGWVSVGYAVNEQGFVESPQVLDACVSRKPIAECQESPKTTFNRQALQAVLKRRYIPLFDDGEPVTSLGMTATITFDVIAVGW